MKIKSWAQAFGFQKAAICDTELSQTETQLQQWIDLNYQGEMHYMHKHGHKRTRPAQLVQNTLRVISLRMDYLPEETIDLNDLLRQNHLAYISRYALGRDYHKLMRKRLQQLASKIAAEIQPLNYRVFVDSAPVMEKPLAAKAGLGWVGKHSNLLDREVGSWFFLGEIYVDIALPIDSVVSEHCGSCDACIKACPTDAIVQPYVVDARRCISYLTIELKGSIPVEFRTAIGNRIYGCDDCQIVCPWNRFAKPSVEKDFQVRHGLDRPSLISLFQWSENEFDKKTQGSAIRRIGYHQWLRNIAIALGNCAYSPEVAAVLQHALNRHSALLDEHIHWALENLNN
ncbi:MAG: tRNA epoxyqueuosine(34) reductase QueG [Gammaproteobacteria bacterium]|nr:tRNA epoxyqueuosine(34) reductase QueG [Gammaproteobacteria bacterium]MDH5731446.1 tRNA epoxyqueuosine(34) reductase QueG [Gammaproteobacteria bacterium]